MQINNFVLKSQLSGALAEKWERKKKEKLRTNLGNMINMRNKNVLLAPTTRVLSLSL